MPDGYYEDGFGDLSDIFPHPDDDQHDDDDDDDDQRDGSETHPDYFSDLDDLDDLDDDDEE